MAAEEGGEDDLEYYVSFPAPASFGAAADDETAAMLSENETAVVVLGWMGSKDRYLAKYSKLYEDFGLTTLRYSPSKLEISQEKRSQSIARRLLEVLEEMNLTDNPVLFHVMSNGGARIYHFMRIEMTMNPDYRHIQKLGVVYDSAPTRARLSALVAVTFAGYPAGFGTTLKKAGFLVGYLTQYFFKYVGSLFGLTFGQAFRKDIYEEMKHYKAECPELFLYSKSDEITPSADVEDMIAMRKHVGVSVTEKCWEKSAHVQHLKSHEKEYAEQCRMFATSCLKKSK